ncbi:MAG: cytochrome c3 family protein [Deltaproteobacteria bacterium]|jgi:hypothetical protein|nr:cytochrome c3 family protein [Deltaproteobacteria bacterium]
MEEKQQKAAGAAGLFGAAAPFLLGLVIALAFGWWLFPGLLFSEKQQPVAFSHKTHLEDAGQSCADCHFLREDGSFSGLPPTEACASCHSSAIGESRAELDYVENYVERGKEVPWLVHQKQPDNVFFSHAAHSQAFCATCHVEFDPEDEENKPDALCSVCHLPVEELDKQVAYRENRLTGYSKTTMKMARCESCHANPNHLGATNSNNACYTCHK